MSHPRSRTVPVSLLIAVAHLACSAPSRVAQPGGPLRRTYRKQLNADLPSMWLPLPANTRLRLVARASSMVGRSRAFDVKGVRFHGDCSGFVEAVYQAEGIPFREAVELTEEDAGSSVSAIYRTVATHGAVFTTEMRPLPGDLVFWNDTYDRNGNGDIDDPLTHVGIVEEVSGNRTVTFLHRGARGVKRGRMNLEAPDAARDGAGNIVNTRLRVVRRGDPAGTRYLAGQLFAAFGRFDPPLLAAALDGSDRLSLDALGLGEGGPEGLPIAAGTAAPASGPVEDEP